MSKLSRRLTASLAAFAPLIPVQLAWAQAPSPGQATPMTIDSLATTLTNMGYEPTVADTRKYLTIKSGDYTINFTFASGTGELLIYIFLQKISDEQLKRLNMKQMLLVNDVGPSWFSIEKDQDSWRIFLQRMMPSAGASPVAIRATVENVVKLTAANEELWNPTRWPPL